MLNKTTVLASILTMMPLLQAVASDVQINCIDNEFVQKEFKKTVCGQKYRLFDFQREDRIKKDGEYHCLLSLKEFDRDILQDTENHTAGDQIKFIDPKCELIDMKENAEAELKQEKYHHIDNYACYDLTYKASVIANHTPGSGSITEMKQIQLNATEKRTGDTEFWGPHTLSPDDALKYAQLDCERAGGKITELKAHVVAITALYRGEPVWSAKGICNGTFYSFKIDSEKIENSCMETENADPNAGKTFIPGHCRYLSEYQTARTPMIFSGPAYMVNVKVHRNLDYKKIPSLFQKWQEDRAASCQQAGH